jgi:hypothetical protein
LRVKIPQKPSFFTFQSGLSLLNNLKKILNGEAMATTAKKPRNVFKFHGRCSIYRLTQGLQRGMVTIPSVFTQQFFSFAEFPNSLP